MSGKKSKSQGIFRWLISGNPGSVPIMGLYPGIVAVLTSITGGGRVV